MRQSTHIVSILLFLGASICQGDDRVFLDDFLDAYCFECHDDLLEKGGVNLMDLAFNPSDVENSKQWTRVFEKIEAGTMPPPEEKILPNAKERERVLATLLDPLAEAERERYAAEGRAALRRLSRDEHIHALQDLLNMPLLTAGEKLPPDSLSDGFGKSSAALPFSHVQIDRYLEVADEALRAAMAPQREKPQRRTARLWVSELKGETFEQNHGSANGQKTLTLARLSPYLHINLKNGGSKPVIGRRLDPTFENWSGNFAERNPGYTLDPAPYIDAVGVLGNVTRDMGRDFKATYDGLYRIRIGAFSYRANHGKVEPTDRTEVVSLYSDSRLLGHIDVTPEPKVREVEVRLKAGEKVSISAASLPLWRIEPKDKETGQRYPVVDVPAVAFQGFEMEGPLIEDWPPASHRRLFGDLPLRSTDASGESALDYEVTSENPEADALRLLTSFMEVAYQRPNANTDIEIPFGTFQRRQSEGASFQEAMISAYAAALSSPRFVLAPMDPGPLPPGQLANRLSLFLWNTPANAALRVKLDTVSDKKIAVVVDEMLADPRVERFVEHFTDHWLDLRNIGTTEPDENLYHGFSPWLKESMLMETRAYFLTMLRDDLPARTVFDSDFAVVNDALAELYGIEGVQGGAVRPVSLPEDSVRGGLVTQASVLKVSANGTTTSPVVRGVYVMDRLLGDPPPPPPEAVPAVEPDLSGSETIRELLAQHREDASCAACHQKIDPPGFALESFDVMGRYRDRYHSLEKGDSVEGLNRRAKPISFKLGLPVDSSGELGGQPFDGIKDFRQLALRDERAIARNLLERLTVYATGAPIGISDREEINNILDQAGASDYGIRSMVHLLAQSQLFRRK